MCTCGLDTKLKILSKFPSVYYITADPIQITSARYFPCTYM